jgi:hypothetical protein
MMSNLYLKVTADNNSIDIKSDDISYGCIIGMYEGNRDGVGMQINENIDPVKAGKMCSAITNAVKEYLFQKEE